MNKLSLFLSIILFCPIYSYSSLASARLKYQDHDSFTSAINTFTSTVNEYVLIQLTNMNNNSTSNVCVEANLFMGAIRHEYELDYSKDGQLAIAREIVISNKSHHFAFSKPKAISNMPFNHSLADVAIIQKFIESYTLAELKTGLNLRGNFYNKVRNNPSIANHFNGKNYLVFSSAFACALIDRGFRVNNGSGLTIVGE